jgi:hypothetical protein
MIDPIVARPGVEHDAVERQLVQLETRPISELRGMSSSSERYATFLPMPGNPTRARGCRGIWRFSSSGMYGGRWSKLRPEAPLPPFALLG